MTVPSMRRTAGSDSGNALVELAVALPMLVLLMVGTIDFARVFYLAIELTNAARAGAMYGAANPGNSGNTATMQTTAANAVNITLDPLTDVAAARTCQCATDSGVFSATVTTPNDCASPPTTSCPAKHLVVTVTVTTTKTFTTIMSGFPGIPNSIALTRAATLRVPN
jgi:Flp pilus assembly protein TadG